MIFVVQIVNKLDSEWRRSAIKCGAAEYVMDSATGATKWQWKAEKP